MLFRAGSAKNHDKLKGLTGMQLALNKKCSNIPVVVYKDLHIFRICALIAGAQLIVATSLHCRIVALVYNVPRITISASPSFAVQAQLFRGHRGLLD